MSDESTFDWDETFYSLQYNTESRGKILKDLRVKEGYEMHRTLNKNDNGCHYSYKKLKKVSPRGRNKEYDWQININNDSYELRRRFGEGIFWNYTQNCLEHCGRFKSTNGRYYFVITKPAEKRESRSWKRRVEKGIKYSEKMMDATDNIEEIRRQKRRRQKRRRQKRRGQKRRRSGDEEGDRKRRKTDSNIDYEI